MYTIHKLRSDLVEQQKDELKKEFHILSLR